MPIVTWIEGRILRLIPERVLARLLPRRLRWNPGALPAPPIVADADIRLYIAPVNFAGQGWLWARSVDEHVANAAAMNTVADLPNAFRLRADRTIPYGAYVASRRWQRSEFEAVADRFTHVMVEAERNPFGAPLDESCGRQVERLRARGVRVMMLCHGSDIRSPELHASTEPESPFVDVMRDRVRPVERQVRRNKELLARLGAPVFVSTPGLLLDVPSAIWLPVVVEPERWFNATPLWSARRPVVVHAPSKSQVKGSEFVDRAMEKLDAEGLIEYRRLSGVAHESMPVHYGKADIVIDQLRLGDYGVAACEAMAAGRVVIGHVSAQVRDHVLAATGRRLPILEATRHDLEHVVRAVLADPRAASDYAAEGPEFVREVHDGRRSAAELASVLR
jgi:hypothetical protein